MKVCTKCGIEKDESEFRKDCKVCKKCRAEYNKLYRIANKEKIKLKQKIYHQKNRDNILSRYDGNKRREYYLTNREKELSKNKEWERKNEEKVKNYRKDYYINNKQKYLDNYKFNKKHKLKKQKELLRIKRNTNIEFKIKDNLRTNFYSWIKRNSKKKTKLFFEYTGIAYADYISYFEQNFPVEFSQITVKGKYHVDHIIPCAVYDFNNPEEIKLCWQPENLRIISAEENLNKKDKLDFDLIEKHNIWHLLPEKLKIKKGA